MAQFKTFLMFTGQAEEAMQFYTSLFANSRIESLVRHGTEPPEMAGKVMYATFSLNGQTFIAIDSPPVHAFTFTPSISIYVTCKTEAELDQAYAALSEGGSVLMPLGPYPFSPKYGWVADRFGVSWQLSMGFTQTGNR